MTLCEPCFLFTLPTFYVAPRAFLCVGLLICRAPFSEATAAFLLQVTLIAIAADADVVWHVSVTPTEKKCCWRTKVAGPGITRHDYSAAFDVTRR